MRARIVRLLKWLLRKAAPPIADALLARTAVLVQEAEALAASGEYKRHVVYARLIKEFPSRLKRDIAFAIEQVLQGLI